MSAVFTFENGEVIDALWHLISPAAEGDRGIEGGVRARAILVAMSEAFPPAASGTGGRQEVADLEVILRELIDKGYVVERSPGHYDLPEADPLARYTVELVAKESDMSFALRSVVGDEFNAELAARIVSDMLGFRRDFILRTRIAGIKPGESRTIGKAIDQLGFRVRRTTNR
jgi:hypothetical protein